MSLRDEPNAARAIADVLGVSAMPTGEAVRTKEEIAEFLASGDATRAAQLIHMATLRKSEREPRIKLSD